MDLLFERFLSEERGEWPDIDLDLPSGDQRERAIQYVYERYGQLGAAMTANVITYRGRSAVRDIGKVLGFDGSRPRALSALVPSWGWNDPQRHRRSASFAKPASIPTIRASRNFSISTSPSRICRAISASIPAAWSSARASSIPSFRSNPPPCPAASSCSGTRTIAPISGSSKWTCSGSA